MKNKVVVTIAGREYTMVAVEDEAYVRKCAALVDQQLKPILSGRLSQADGAVLAAMNIADQYFKEQEAAEHLRQQIKDSLDEIAQLAERYARLRDGWCEREGEDPHAPDA